MEQRQVQTGGGVGGLCNSDLQEFDLRLTYPGCGTEILDQGGCGSCWAFGTAEAVSDRFCVLGHHLSVSPQTLVSCPDSQGSCSGGNPWYAYKYIASNGLPWCADQCTSGCEPYGSGRQKCASGQKDTLHDNCYGPIHTCGSEITCIFGDFCNKHKVRNHVEGRLDTDQETVKAQLRTHGSVTASFAHYSNWNGWVKKKGANQVYDTHEGSAHMGYHAIKISGYGTMGGKKYWLVQNSWGSGFGDGGYIKMLRNTTTSEENGILEDIVNYATPIVNYATPDLSLSEDSEPELSSIDHVPQGRIAGGWMKADHGHPELWGLARATHAQVNVPGGFVALKAVEIQVVAGFNARFTVETTAGEMRIEAQFDIDGNLRDSPLVSSLVV